MSTTPGVDGSGSTEAATSKVQLEYTRSVTVNLTDEPLGFVLP